MSEQQKAVETLVLPSLPETEQMALGCAMADARAAKLACEALSPSDFIDPRNKIIFSAMQKIYAAKEPVDSVTVLDRMKLDKTFNDVGMEYLEKIGMSFLNPDQIAFYAKKLRANTTARKMLYEMRKQQSLYAQDPTEDSLSFVAKVKEAIDKIACDGVDTDFETAEEIVPKTIDKLDKARSSGKKGLTGLDTGFIELNRITHGWQPGELIIVAGRPSMGKSAFAANVAANACKAGATVAFFSLEMESSAILTRMESAESGVSLERIKTGTVTQQEYDRFVDAAKRISGFPLFFDDKTTGLLADVVADSDRMKMNDERLGLIVIDYVNLMKLGQKVESRQAEISAISASLKRMAKDLQVPVILLAQLNRDADSVGDGEKPSMSSLKDSGSLEQDADVVLLLHRDSYYQARQRGEIEPSSSVTDAIVAKNREGRIGIVNLVFQMELSRFSDCSSDFYKKKEAAPSKPASVED